LAILARDDVPRQSRPEVAAIDLLAIVRGMTDTAGEHGETDVADLRSRIEPAVFGYPGRGGA
jgi:hypothetical protein